MTTPQPSQLELIWLEAVVAYGIAFDSRQPQFTRGRLSGLTTALEVLTGVDREDITADIRRRYSEITGKEI